MEVTTKTNSWTVTLDATKHFIQDFFSRFGQKKKIKEYLDSEMKKLASGEAAVPTKKMLLVMHEEKIKPQSAARCLLVAEMEHKKIENMPDREREEKLLDYTNFFIAANSAIVSKGPRIIQLQDNN